MTIKNGDMPAMPFEEVKTRYQGLPDEWANHQGLTKREMFCLYMGVAETGDAELDEIIRKGNRQKMAVSAMHGILSSLTAEDSVSKRELAGCSIADADALLAELEAKK